MDSIIQIQQYAHVALQGASGRAGIRALYPRHGHNFVAKWNRRLPQNYSKQLEQAVIQTLQFRNRINQTVLYLLREMEVVQAYRDLGFPDLASWAYAKLHGVTSDDTIGRLCATVTKVIAPLDALPVITQDGEKITGLSLIANASPSALMKVSGTFANSERNEQGILASGLMTGTSDDRYLKGKVGWEPRIGKAQAQFKQTKEDEVFIRIRATNAQARVIEKELRWLLEIQMTDL